MDREKFLRPMLKWQNFDVILDKYMWKKQEDLIKWKIISRNLLILWWTVRC